MKSMTCFCVVIIKHPCCLLQPHPFMSFTVGLICCRGIARGSQIYFEDIWGYGPSTGIRIRLGLFNRSPIVSVISKEGVSICVFLGILRCLNYCFMILRFVLDSSTHLCVIQNFTILLRRVDQFYFIMQFLKISCAIK